MSEQYLSPPVTRAFTKAELIDRARSYLSERNRVGNEFYNKFGMMTDFITHLFADDQQDEG